MLSRTPNAALLPSTMCSWPPYQHQAICPSSYSSRDPSVIHCASKQVGDSVIDPHLYRGAPLPFPCPLRTARLMANIWSSAFGLRNQAAPVLSGPLVRHFHSRAYNNACLTDFPVFFLHAVQYQELCATNTRLDHVYKAPAVSVSSCHPFPSS